jgi:hypothetical protein
MAQVGVIISLSDDLSFEERKAAYEALCAAGLGNPKDLADIEMVTGEFDEDKLDTLRAIAGVVAVEPERQVSI